MSGPLLSIIVATARKSWGSLIGNDIHLMQLTLDSLKAQTFKNFELVVVDSAYRQRDLMSEMTALGIWDFPIMVTHPESWWLDNRMWALQNAFNRGFCASSGKQLVFCGDCCHFPPHALERASELINKGFSPNFLFVYTQCGKLIARNEGFNPNAVGISGLINPENVQTPFTTIDEARAAGQWNNQIVRDCRWDTVDLQGFVPPDKFPWNGMFGYASVKREDFEYVNGYDENFDGDKSLGDVEIGSRLSMAGRWSQCLSADVYVFEHWHTSLPVESFRSIGCLRSNLDLIYLMRKRGLWRGNSATFTKEECLDVIHAKIMNIDGYAGRPFVPTEETYPFQEHWINNPPIFDLCQ